MSQEPSLNLNLRIVFPSIDKWKSNLQKIIDNSVSEDGIPKFFEIFLSFGKDIS